MTDKTIDLARDAFVSGAYALQGADDAQSFYRLWADEYEDHMVGELGYVSPRLTAERLTRHLSRTDAEVLDIGCGTGLTCDHLHEQGFRRLDGVDLTPAMLAKSAARGIYRRLSRADLTLPIDMPDACYDAMVSSGTIEAWTPPQMIGISGNSSFRNWEIWVANWYWFETGWQR